MTSKILKFIYSEKATKFCEVSTVDLSYVVPVKSMAEISQNFVAFSDYMNFKIFDVTLRTDFLLIRPSIIAMNNIHNFTAFLQISSF